MNKGNKKETLLVALDGNALVRRRQEGTIEEQLENLKTPIRQIARLFREYKIIITHGNAPQVGNLLLQQESCDTVPKLPLEILVANSGTDWLHDQIKLGQCPHENGDPHQTTIDKCHQLCCCA